MCVKTAGREAGRYCVIVKKVDANFVLVTGPKSLTKVRRRKCNIEHLEPLMEKVSIKADASDEEVTKAYKADGILAKLERKVKVEAKPVGAKPEVAEKAKPEVRPKPPGKPKEEKKEEPKPKAKPKKAVKKPSPKAQAKPKAEKK